MEGVWGAACLQSWAQLSVYEYFHPSSGSDCPTVRWAHGDSESALSRGNVVETRRQMHGQLSVKPTNCHEEGEGKSGWTHPTPPTLLPPHHNTWTPRLSHQASSFTRHFSLNTTLPKMSRQRCTKMSRLFAPTPTPFLNIQTHMQAYTYTPPVNQQPECHAVRDAVRKKRGENDGRKAVHFITYCPLCYRALGDNTKEK